MVKGLKFELILTNPGFKSKDRQGNPGSKHPDDLPQPTRPTLTFVATARRIFGVSAFTAG
jgi:hypothetical protein